MPKSTITLTIDWDHWDDNEMRPPTSAVSKAMAEILEDSAGSTDFGREVADKLNEDYKGVRLIEPTRVKARVVARSNPTVRRRKKNPSRKAKGSQRVNQLVRDQFRDLYNKG